MVVKNPFLSEKDDEIQFLARNLNAYRGLGSLFPAADLVLATNIVNVANSKRLTLGFTYKAVTKGRHRTRSKVALASTLLRQSLGENVSESAYQRHLDMACDLRILKKMPREYHVHSYGLPLTYLYTCRDWSHNNPSLDQSWWAYYADRLLSEDGDYISAILRMASEGIASDESAKALGIRMHELVFERLSDRIKERFPYAIKNFLRQKITDYEKSKRDTSKTLRRTELEFSVRRDWLTGLGLITPNGTRQLTPLGEKMHAYLLNHELTIESLTQDFFKFLCSAWGMRGSIADPLATLEQTYEKMTQGKANIVETLSLINATIFSSFPSYIGERQGLLDDLANAIGKSQTRLILQSGYRTRDYYVKMR